ncbi:MAG: response regulator [Burkholderiales bacterium]|nr:response regulator [Burkholderiales bacterium]
MSGVILVVGSSVEKRKSISNSLKNLNFTNFVEASDGLDAINKLRENSNYKLVLSDWNVHCHNTTLIKKIRGDSDIRINKTPVIGIASNRIEENVKSVAKNDFNNLIFTPFDFSLFKQKIEEVLSK